jgi:hypothetical protein
VDYFGAIPDETLEQVFVLQKPVIIETPTLLVIRSKTNQVTVITMPVRIRNQIEHRPNDQLPAIGQVFYYLPIEALHMMFVEKAMNETGNNAGHFSSSLRIDQAGKIAE